MAQHLHSHTHHHTHSHHAADPTQRAFVIGISLNLLFVAVELAFGFWSNSLALLADAGHNFSDVLGLLIAWGALLLARRKPSTRYTYGLRSSTIMAALLNAMLLLVAVGGIVWEGAQRLIAPQPVSGSVVVWVALLGVVINFGTALMLHRGSQHDINVRGAFLHMLADAAVSVGVAVSGLLMLWLGWHRLDGAISIIIALVILFSTWGLFRESFNLSLHAVPAHIDAEAVRDYLDGLPGVEEVHDLHIWGMSTTEIALTAHLLMPDGHPGDAFLHNLADALAQQFHINHPTLQIETGSDAAACRLAPEDVV